MNTARVRCNRPGFATVEIAASIGATRLEVGTGTRSPRVSVRPACLELTEFFGSGDPDPHLVPENAPTVRDRGGASGPIPRS